MRKKLIVTGLLLFWTGVAAYMGMRILESYAEDAVQASLSAIPATVEEIRFSLLDKSLKLKGIRYEIPDEKIQRKGRIEEIEVKGFNRKILYVLPKMEAYAPDALPKVADAVSIKGFSETSHKGYEIITRNIGNMDIANWHQRLGLLFDQYSRYGAGEKFYEELFRCRMDEVSFSSAELSVKSSADAHPSTFRVTEGKAPGGVRAPQANEQVSPFSLRLTGITYTGDGCTGALDVVELKDILFPKPKQLVQLMEYCKASDFGTEETIGKIKETLALAYEDSLPLASVGASGGRFSIGGVSSSLKNVLYANKKISGGEEYTLKVQALHIPAEAAQGYADIVKRFAPNGVEFSLDATNRNDGATMSGNAEYTFKDLGKLRVSGEFLGNAKMFQFSNPENGLDDVETMLSKVEVKKFSVDYEDHGLMPLCLALLSKGEARKLEYGLFLAQQQIAVIRGTDGVFCAQLADVLEEQLSAPGTVHASFDSETPVSLMRLGMMLLMGNGEPPMTLTSAPGSKALESYPILR